MATNATLLATNKVLDGKMTKKDFSIRLQEIVPNYVSQKGHEPFSEVLKDLIDLTNCTAIPKEVSSRFHEVESQIDMPDNDILQDYFHTIYLAVFNAKDRIEQLFSYEE